MAVLWAWDGPYPVMSYRRLITLISALGPNSVALNTRPAKPGNAAQQHGQDVRVIDADENPEAFDAWLQGLVTKQPNTPDIQA